jgi:hypothetical protein
MNNPFDLELRIAGPLARLSLGASHHLVDSALYSICIYKSTSVDSSLASSTLAIRTISI